MSRAVERSKDDYWYLDKLNVIVYDDAEFTYVCKYCLSKTRAVDLGLAKSIPAKYNCESTHCRSTASYKIYLTYLTDLELLKYVESLRDP